LSASGSDLCTISARSFNDQTVFVAIMTNRQRLCRLLLSQ
jgi:hypothetical protein